MSIIEDRQEKLNLWKLGQSQCMEQMAVAQCEVLGHLRRARKCQKDPLKINFAKSYFGDGLPVLVVPELEDQGVEVGKSCIYAFHAVVVGCTDMSGEA